MDPLEFFGIITVAVGGFVLVGYMIHKISALIKFRMERKYDGNSRSDQQVLQHLKEMQVWRIKAEKRMQNLEQIVSDEDSLHQLGEVKRPLFDENDAINQVSQSGSVPNQLRRRS